MALESMGNYFVELLLALHCTYIISLTRLPTLLLHRMHWRSAHHVRNKNSNTQGSLPNVLKVNFPYLQELLLKERIRPLWEQILSFKRSSYFEKGRNYRESLLDTVVSLWCA